MYSAWNSFAPWWSMASWGTSKSCQELFEVECKEEFKWHSCDNTWWRRWWGTCYQIDSWGTKICSMVQWFLLMWITKLSCSTYINCFFKSEYFCLLFGYLKYFIWVFLLNGLKYIIMFIIKCWSFSNCAYCWTCWLFMTLRWLSSGHGTYLKKKC